MNTRHTILAAIAALPACAGAELLEPGPAMVEVLVTSAAGQKQASVEPTAFKTGDAEGVTIAVFPNDKKQTIDGIGSSFTESSAFVLAHLDPALRHEVMRRAFSDDGANFSLTRTHIGSCDFCVDGKYDYTPDGQLAGFTIQPDLAGFDPAVYPGVKDPRYDLLPMIQEAQAIKNEQADTELRIIGSAWTAPPWMKDVGEYFVRMTPENNWQGTGGSLKPEHEQTYADYLVRYLDAYAELGVPIWGLTPVNEPHGNSGQWESMHFTPETQRDFIKNFMGPALKNSSHPETRILIYDQNRDGLEEWTDTILGDPETSQFVYGIAVHWYSSTFKVHEDAFDRVHAKFPRFPIVHTEGCVDDLGKPAPDGIGDPERFHEHGWFQNDAWWWAPTATDWAYTAPWAAPSAEDHPVYVPVHRYARNIIVSIDHWLSGWVDWNLVLDERGGPNHVGNFAAAPIMIDTSGSEVGKQDVYYTPVFDVLSQFSRTIRPGDVAVRTEQNTANLDPDALHACATLNPDGVLSVQLLNTTGKPIELNLKIGESYAPVTVPANAVQTVRVQI